MNVTIKIKLKIRSTYNSQYILSQSFTDLAVIVCEKMLALLEGKKVHQFTLAHTTVSSSEDGKNMFRLCNRQMVTFYGTIQGGEVGKCWWNTQLLYLLHNLGSFQQSDPILFFSTGNTGFFLPQHGSASIVNKKPGSLP